LGDTYAGFFGAPVVSADLVNSAAELFDGADATRRAIGAAYYHPLAVRRFAPTIKQLQQTVGPASKLAVPAVADPQPRSAYNDCIGIPANPDPTEST